MYTQILLSSSEDSSNLTILANTLDYTLLFILLLGIELKKNHIEKSTTSYLKLHNQAKIIKKSVILFQLLYVTIRCKHRLKLKNCCNFCVAHLPVKRDIKTKFPYFLFWTCMSDIRHREFRLYISLNW